MPRCSASNNRRPRRRTGFTLVELLVAMAVASIILVVLMQLLSQVMNAWSGETKRESSLREARSGLRLLADDLACIQPIPAADDPAVEAARQRFILRIPAGNYDSSAFAFLKSARTPRRNAATQAERGDLRLVAYAVATSNDANGAVSQKLWRKEYSAEETWIRLKTHLETGGPLFEETDWDPINTPAHGAEPIVYDLIRAVITPLQVQPDGSLLPVTTWDSKDIPSHLDITLRVTNRATAALLDSDLDWQARGPRQPLLIGHSLTPTDYTDDPEVRTFTLRLSLGQNNVTTP